MTRSFLLGVVCVMSLGVAACVPAEDNHSEAGSAPYTTVVPSTPRAESPGSSPVPPGTALDVSSREPVPGENFDFNLCTVAWSFVLDDARTIAVTASHCGEPGDTVWAGNAEGEFTYPADPVGSIIYSDLSAPDTHGLDFALVEISRQAEFYSPQDMPTSVAAAGESALPAEVCKLGRITGETCGQLTHREGPGKLTYAERTVDTVSARAQACSARGDSGAPVYGAPGTSQEGIIVGVLSGTTDADIDGVDCANGAGAEMSFTVAADIEAVLPEILDNL